MVAEPWTLKKMVSNQVSQNLKHKPSKKPDQKQTIGILSFEIANAMSKTIHLHNSLTDQEMFKLKNDIFKSEGVQKLVSVDELYLLELALAEKLEDLNRVANIVSRLGKKCTEPALRGFEHVYSDLVNGVISVHELGFLVKDMEAMVRKMEKYVNSTSSLYSELEVLNELEQASKKFQLNQHEDSRRSFDQKLIWQKQDVRHLKDVSLWNQTYDKVVELLARTVCTIYARICVVFGDNASRRVNNLGLSTDNSRTVSGQIDVQSGNQTEMSKCSSYRSGSIEKVAVVKKGVMLKTRNDFKKSEVANFQHDDFVFPCGNSPARAFMECLSLSSSASEVEDEEDDEFGYHENRHNRVSGQISRRDYSSRSHLSCFNLSEVSGSFNVDHRQARIFSSTNSSRFMPKTRLSLQGPPSTIGGSALALHYANIIIVIEKLLRYPHLVGEEARDDLYQLLPTSLKTSLKSSLKLYVKDLAIFDASLAHDWKYTLDRVLGWLVPMASNMMRWQSERNFEQQQIVTRANVLLIQTLHFADREKTEAAICELLVGLNYICRYEHQQNALLDCASSFDFEDCMEWQLRSAHLC